MHELPVTENILEIALRHAQEAGAKRILQINLVIGQLASIVDDSVVFYWDMISKDTPAEGAQLKFQRIPANLRCLDCNLTYELADSELICPACDSTNLTVISGKEFYLASIDVE